MTATMSITEIRDRIAIAAAMRMQITVRLKNGTTLRAIPEGSAHPRWFFIGDQLVHQYQIEEVTED